VDGRRDCFVMITSKHYVTISDRNDRAGPH
jgi:hypothetical protein